MLIRAKDLSKSYQMDKVTIHALQNVSLDIAEGEFISLMGPSGAGKSTLLHILGCLDNPDQGSVEIHGQPIQRMKDSQLSVFRNRHIGFIFQSFNLMPVLNVYENVEFPLLIRGGKVDRDKVLQTIEAVGLLDYLKHRPDELSGGQRQRVAIARALVTEPDIILADEPTANLDSKTGEKIITLLLELNSRQRVTFLFSTHHDMIARHAKRIINILDGQLIE